MIFIEMSAYLRRFCYSALCAQRIKKAPKRYSCAFVFAYICLRLLGMAGRADT